MSNLSISHTAYPDRTSVYYLYGMPKPQVINMAHVMKAACRWHLNRAKRGGVSYKRQQAEVLKEFKLMMAR